MYTAGGTGCSLGRIFILLSLLLSIGTGTDTGTGTDYISMQAMPMHSVFGGEKLTISTLNCNLLNMSQLAKWNQTLKICGITKLKTDIIFLSDVRISNKNMISSADDLRRCFLNNPYCKYDFYFNSSRN
jgi:hypothetical protein